MVCAFMVWTYLVCLTIDRIAKHHESSSGYSYHIDYTTYFLGIAQAPYLTLDVPWHIFVRIQGVM